MTSSPSVPAGPAAPLSDPATAIRTVRIVALLTLVLGGIGSLVLLTDRTALGDRSGVGQGLGLIAVTLAVVTLLLFAAGWVEHSLARANATSPVETG